MLIAAWSYPVIRPQSILLDKLLRYYPDQGIEVDLLTINQTSKYQGVSVTNYDPPGTIKNAILQRLFVPNTWNYTGFAHSSAIKKGGEIINKKGIQLIMTFANPYYVNIIGALLKIKTGIPLVIHYSDPYVYNPFKNYSKRQENEFLDTEKKVFDVADSVVFVNEQLSDYVFNNNNIERTNFKKVIPHSYDPELYSGSGYDKERNDVVFRHIGSFYGHRTPETFLKALSHLREIKSNAYDKMRVEFVGANLLGNHFAVESIIVKYGLQDKVKCLPIVSYAESLMMMGNADVLVSIDGGCPQQIFLPSKLIDYLGARRPILCLTSKGSPSAEIVINAGGHVAEISSYHEISQKIEHLVSNHNEIKLNKEFVDRFNTSNVVREWKKLYNSIIS